MQSSSVTERSDYQVICHPVKAQSLLDRCRAFGPFPGEAAADYRGSPILQESRGLPLMEIEQVSQRRP